MTSVVMRDISHAGHDLGGARLSDLPRRASLRQLLRARITGEVAEYNADPGRLFAGLVQPADSIRHRDGFRLSQPRELDAERLVTAAEEATALGVLSFEIDGEPTDDIDRVHDLEDIAEITVVLRRSVVAATPG